MSGEEVRRCGGEAVRQWGSEELFHHRALFKQQIPAVFGLKYRVLVVESAAVLLRKREAEADALIYLTVADLFQPPCAAGEGGRENHPRSRPAACREGAGEWRARL